MENGEQSPAPGGTLAADLPVPPAPILTLMAVPFHHIQIGKQRASLLLVLYKQPAFIIWYI